MKPNDTIWINVIVMNCIWKMIRRFELPYFRWIVMNNVEMIWICESVMNFNETWRDDLHWPICDETISFEGFLMNCTWMINQMISIDAFLTNCNEASWNNSNWDFFWWIAFGKWWSDLNWSFFFGELRWSIIRRFELTSLWWIALGRWWANLNWDIFDELHLKRFRFINVHVLPFWTLI
jgi:hypothetical protein